jgi:hypothetical protein
MVYSLARLKAAARSQDEPKYVPSFSIEFNPSLDFCSIERLRFAKIPEQ